jgi:hypothetical protein
MTKAARKLADNLVPLRRPRRSPAQERAARTAGQVRRQLSLLQGYADLMEGLSPKQNAQILRVMAEKIRELTVALHPFVEQAGGGIGAIEDYRQARMRTRQLLADYRQLLVHLHHTVNDVHPGVTSPVA